MDWVVLRQWAEQLLQSRWADVLYVFLIVLAVLVCNAVLKRVLERYARRTDAAAPEWRKALPEAMNPALRGVVWIVGRPT